MLVLLLLLQGLNCFGQNVDYYIKQWVVDNDHNFSSGEQVGGYDNNLEIFYILGGNSPGDTTNEYTYNPYNNVYEQNQSIQATATYQGQAHTTMIASNGSVYIFFDNTNYDYPNANFFIFDMQSNTETQIGKLYPKPYQSIYECFTSSSMYVYIIGGMDYGGNSLQTFYQFDINQNEWSSGPELNKARVSSACIYVENKLFIFGGDFPVNTVNNGNNTIETINIESNINNSKWKMIDTIIQNKYFAFPTAFYPSKNVVTKDKYKSNTIFITSACVYPEIFSCYKFNFRSYEVDECNSLPSVNVTGYFGSYGYIQNEYRFYLFGSDSSGSAVPFQYAVLNYNESTLDSTNIYDER